MGLVYLFVLWFHIPFIHFLKLAGASVVTISGFASLGYLLNDLFDIEKDKAAGKPNMVQGKPVMVVVLLFATALSALLLPWLYLPFNKLSLLLIIAEVATFIVYSAPPVRLKDRGAAGIIADTLYAHLLPLMLAANTFIIASGATVNVRLMGVLLLLQAVSGIRNIIIHQYQDAEADRLGGTTSFFLELSKAGFERIMLCSILAEVALLSLFYALLAYTNRFLLLCQPVIWLYALTVLLLFARKGLLAFLNSTWRYFPNNLWELWLPVTLLIVLSVEDSRFVLMVLLHVLLFNHKVYVEVYNRALIPTKGHVKYLLVKMMVSTRFAVSFVVNFSLYLGFLLFGVDLKKENVSALEYLRKHRKK